MNFWINSQTIYSNFLPLFISISKTLELNWYKIFFINPNKIQKYQLKKYWINFIKGKNEKIIKKNNITKILIWNWTNNDYKIKWVKNYYFENWYFWNDLQIFNNWVNAKSEISKINYVDFLNYKNNNKIKINKLELIKNINLNIYNYYFLWFLSQNPIDSIKNYKTIIKSKIENYKRKKILNNIKEIELKNWKYIIIGFQVHDDTQITHNSIIINKMEHILNYFYNDIKIILPDYKIIVKEHPMDIWRINYSNLQKKYNDIIWIKKWDIWNYIDKSEYLICVNSSIWLQALSKYKKVITLWNNFYSNNPWVKNIKNKNEFKEKLIKLKNQNILKDKLKIDKYINIFKNEIFISNWWWKIFDKNIIQYICNKIIN